MEMIRKTIEKDEEYLRQISKEVSFEKDDYKKDIEKLEEFCNQTECFALAAVQIGIPKRIVYLKNTRLDVDLEDVSYNEARILINPKVTSRKGKTQYWEACLSCLDNMGLVTRPYEMTVEYYDIEGKKQKEKFEGFESTVLSHELDHLDGILHMDIAEKVIVMPREERKKYREKHPYKILSKTGAYERKSRIEINEKRLDNSLKIVKKLEKALNDFEKNQVDLHLLNQYYGSKDWLKEKEELEKKPNPSIKAGVLSEDGVWNLMEDVSELKDTMKKIIEEKEQK